MSGYVVYVCPQCGAQGEQFKHCPDHPKDTDRQYQALTVYPRPSMTVSRAAIHVTDHG